MAHGIINGVNQGSAVQGTVDFGFLTGQEENNASITVSAPWVSTGSIIVASPSGIATADHAPDDYMVEGLHCGVSNIVAGVGFDINVYADNGTFGQYIINARGV